MTNRFWIALPLAAALALPMAAQNSAPANSSQQPAQAQSQPAQTQSAQPAQAQEQDDIRQPLTPQPHEGFWGRINPFARKKYVQRQLDPIRARVGELDDLNSKNAAAIKDVDARAQEGIRNASTAAAQADQHAVDAGNKAQQANQTAQDAMNRLQTTQTAVDNVDNYKVANQVEIIFRPGNTLLSRHAQNALGDIASPLKSQQGYVIEVQGFSSGRGIAAVENSQNLAEAVARYMVLKQDIPVHRIYVVGMGNAPMNRGNGRPRRTRGGRVEVSVLQNGIAEMQATSQPSNTMPVSSESAPAGTTAQPPAAQPQPAAPQTGAPATTPPPQAQPSSNPSPVSPAQPSNTIPPKPLANQQTQPVSPN